MKLWSIQVLRFVAALLVVRMHAVNNVWALTKQLGIGGYAWANFGHCGVDIFFVISGFIITRTAKGLSVGEFIARRARRILPLYYAVSAGWILAYAATSHIGWRTFIATWLLWPATDVETAPIIPMGWTLCFEALFYATFALILWRPKARWPVAAVFIGALVFPANAVLKFIGNPLIFEFLAGVVLAYVPAWRPAIFGIFVGVALLVAGTILGATVTGLPVNALAGVSAWPRLLVSGVPAVLVVWGTIQLSAREGVLTHLGDASYALYLIHPPVVAGTVFLLVHFFSLPADVVVVLATAASVMIAWRVHELFEKPVLARLKKAMAV